MTVTPIGPRSLRQSLVLVEASPRLLGTSWPTQALGKYLLSDCWEVMETACHGLASRWETHSHLGPGLAMLGRSPWLCVELGAAPPLQGGLGIPEDIPSCEEKGFKYNFLPLSL